MSNDFLGDSGRRSRLTMIVAGVLAVAAVILGLAYAVTRSGRSDGTTAQPSASASSVTVPTGPLKLIKGARTVEGIGVGYPHTTAGAVSAASEYLTQVMSNLDSDRARAIAPVVADSSFSGAGDYFAQGPVNVRRTLGLPESGPVPAGASVTLGPAAYQLRSASPDTVTVLILAYYTTSTPAGGVKAVVGAYPAEMHWDNGDWKILKPGVSKEADYRPLVTQPGTADAQAKGWMELTP